MTMPLVIWFSSASHAPQPRMPIWVHSRRNFDRPVIMMLRSCADHLRLQRLHRLAAPDLHAFGDHAHGIDDLGIAGHRIRLQIRPWRRKRWPG